jgi:hypothetical protein
MARQSRRVRQRLVRKLNAISDRARERELARKERIAKRKLNASFPDKPNGFRLVNLSPERLSGNSINAVGSRDGKITVRGLSDGLGYSVTVQPRGLSRKVNTRKVLTDAERLLVGLRSVMVAACLTAVYDGEPEIECQKAWLLTQGFSLIRWLGFEPILTGSEPRSIRAQNSGAGTRQQMEKLKRVRKEQAIGKETRWDQKKILAAVNALGEKESERIIASEHT